MSTRLLLAAAMLLAYVALCARIAWRWQQDKAALLASVSTVSDPLATTLVVHASQTGTAEHLALQTAQGLRAQGQAVRLLALNALTADMLAKAKCAWFIVSTYGEGDAPDGASVFADQQMQPGQHTPTLGGLQCGVLALGDRQYDQFCAFGHRLYDWLCERGAQAAFEPVEVNNGDSVALAQWQNLLALGADLGVAATAFSNWQVTERVHTNPGSQGNPLHWLTLVPTASPLPDWQAGDLLQLIPHATGGTHSANTPAPREYSIASVPAQGAIQLLVRHERQALADGGWQLGLASTQLCESQPGDSWQVCVRPHAGFRIQSNAQRPLVLIGNGSGLAGLHAHIQARRQQQQAVRSDTWLIYGERQRAHDAWFAPEWQRWLDDGSLQHLSLSYSRDGGDIRYVQDIVRQEAVRLRSWIDSGAAIYLCGSLQGMASDVDAALRDILGADCVNQLLLEGRLRRDVY